jgi:hypothetical protein
MIDFDAIISEGAERASAKLEKYSLKRWRDASAAYFAAG